MAYSRETLIREEEVFIDGLGTHRAKAYGETRPPEPLETQIKYLTRYLEGLATNTNWTRDEKIRLHARAEARLQRLRRIVGEFRLEERVAKTM